MTTQTAATAITGWVPEQDFAIRLLLSRKHLGLTVREAALRCGVHYATWSTWERGSRPHDMAAAVQSVADGLGVDRAWLMWGSASPIGHITDSTWNRRSEVVTLGMSDVTESLGDLAPDGHPLYTRLRAA